MSNTVVSGDGPDARLLLGKRVLVTRTRQQASGLATELQALGAIVSEVPTIELAEPEDWAPVDEALLHIPAYDWVVFTSANGVKATWQRLRHLDFDARHFGASEVAAMGPATAEALHAIGIYPDLLPEKFVGEELAAEIKARIPDLQSLRFLLLRADIARPVLREELIKGGAQVEDIAVYRTVMPAELSVDYDALLGGKIDWITFTSASTAENFAALLRDDARATMAQWLPKVKILSIGPITTAALIKVGMPPTVEASQHDIPGMIAALREHVAAQPR